MSQWTNPRTGKPYGEVYSSDELTVTYFERHGSPDCVDGDFVAVGGRGDPRLSGATGKSSPAPSGIGC